MAFILDSDPRRGYVTDKDGNVVTIFQETDRTADRTVHFDDPIKAQEVTANRRGAIATRLGELIEERKTIIGQKKFQQAHVLLARIAEMDPQQDKATIKLTRSGIQLLLGLD